MVKVEKFHFNGFFRASEYNTAYETALAWINENDIDVISITEIADSHYNLSIHVWYREGEFALC